MATPQIIVNPPPELAAGMGVRHERRLLEFNSLRENINQRRKLFT